MNDYDQKCCCPHHRTNPAQRDWAPLILLVLATLVGVGIKFGPAAVDVILLTAVCAPPAIWLARQVIGEIRLRRLYDRHQRVQPACRRPPLAIEAPRPNLRPPAVIPIVINSEDAGRAR